MDFTPDLSSIFSLVPLPTFYVKKGVITRANPAASALLFSEGTRVSDFLGSNQWGYWEFTSGCLYMGIRRGSKILHVCVTRFNDGDLFVVEEAHEPNELRTLCVTATAMRQPVSAVIATAGSMAELLKSNNDPKATEYIAQMNRQLWRIHRMLCNMSDAAHFADDYVARLRTQNLTKFISEIFQKAQHYAQFCGINLVYSVPDTEVRCLIDTQLIERAIYNMISNAIKASDKGTSINASFTVKDTRLLISIQDQGRGIPTDRLGDLFKRYGRQPGVNDVENGLGLGMVLIRCAALAHAGTVLIDHPEKVGTRVTLSFPMRVNKQAFLYAQGLDVDYAGNWDHGLLEFADVLPAHLYEKC